MCIGIRHWSLAGTDALGYNMSLHWVFAPWHDSPQARPVAQREILDLAKGFGVGHRGLSFF
jgi:hypothetical protein